MTTKLPPGSPPLIMDGEEQSKEGDTVADSSWEGEDTTAEDTQANLAKIARKRGNGK